MKRVFHTKTLIALAVAIAAAAGAVSQAQEQPIPPPSTDSAMPSDITPGSPLAEVSKMIQAGVDASTIKNYVLNSPNAFNLDADKILYLKDLGAPSDLINAMMDRDKALYASSVAPPPPAAPPAATPPPDTAPPPADVTVNYFYDTLTPYGSWVDIDGYGRCWRPTVVVYDSGWSPYCDRGHWVYTDYGWYWDSDYSWGATFHYGRWFRNSRFGWCWLPDTVWAPSWVAWRSGGDYCGWAPLPPFAVYRPGAGFFYRGVSVGVDFDFGLAPDCFVFLSPGHFCDRHPRSFCVDRARVTTVFHQTTVINNFSVHDKVVVNRGFGPDRITAVTHHTIEPIHVSSLPNASHQGWRGDRSDHGAARSAVDNGHENRSFTSTGGRSGPAGGNDSSRHGPETINRPGTPVNTGHRDAGNTAQTSPGGWSNGRNNNLNQDRGHNPTTADSSQTHAGQTVTPGTPATPTHPGNPAQPGRVGQPGNQNQQWANREWQQPGQPATATPRQPGTPTAPSAPQQSQNQNQWQGNRNYYGNAPGNNNSSGVIHGGQQLQERQYTAPAPQPPRQDNFQNQGGYQQHNNNPQPSSPAPSQSQGQSRGGGNSGGSGNNGSNNGNGNGRQNH